MARIILGTILLFLNFFLATAILGARAGKGDAFDRIWPMTVVLAPLGVLLLYWGWRSRQQNYKPLLKGRHWAILIGSACFVIHYFVMRGLFAGTATWDTPHIVLVNVLLDIVGVSCLVGPLLASDQRSTRMMALPAIVLVPVALIAIEVVVNNRHRDVLVKQMTSGSEAERVKAASVLAKTGYRARVADLAAALHDPNESVRVNAAGALGQSETTDAIAPLCSALDDESERVQLAAIAGLRALPNKHSSAVPALARYLDRTGGREAAIALMEYGGDGAEAALNRALDRGQAAAVAGAWKFFVEAGRAGTEPALIRALNADGNSKMAEAFLNCGNPQLADAAMNWAQDHGYRIERTSGAGGVRWGR